MNQNPWVEMRDGRAPRLCEYGIITFASSEPLRELYELMQMEMVRKIDGTRFVVKVNEIPE